LRFSGKIEKLNTSAFGIGDVIYLDSIPGKYTKSKPQAPYHLVYLGAVVKSNNGNGSIFVKVQNGYELEELHNVQINSPANNQVLVYSDTSKLWKNRPVTALGVPTSIGTFSTTGNANGLSLSSGVLTGHAATATTPGMVSTGAQDFAGNKTFRDQLYINNGANIYGSLRGGGNYFEVESNGTRELHLNRSNTTPVYISNTNSFSQTSNSLTATSFTNSVSIGSGYIFRMDYPSLAAGKFRIAANGQTHLQDIVTAAPTMSAGTLLQLESTTRGFLPPRLNATQRNAISTPAAGLMVYDTDSSRYMLYGSSWKGLAYTDAGGGSSGSIATSGSTLYSTNPATSGFSTIQSIYLGGSAGSNASGSFGSVFLGTSAGNNAINASGSFFVGNSSGYFSTSANLSNFIGYFTGANATNASQSNFLGYYSGQYAAGATKSNFLGSYSGYNATGASYSNLFGYNVANAATTAASIGTNNIIIGTNISLPRNTANSLNLGGILFGVNTYGTTTGNPDTTAQQAGRIGIRTVVPATSAALEINGTTGSLLVPRLNTTQTNALTPVAGMVHYNSDSSRLVAYNGTAWKGIAYTDAGGGGGGGTTSASGTGISLVNGSSLVKRLKAGFNTIVTDNADSVTISRDTLTQTLTDGATITYSATAGVSARVTLGGNRTLSITNMNNGMYLTLLVVQDGTGGRTLTLPAGTRVVNGGAGAVTLSSAANAQDILTFFEINNVLYCNVGRNYN